MHVEEGLIHVAQTMPSSFIWDLVIWKYKERMMYLQCLGLSFGMFY